MPAVPNRLLKKVRKKFAQAVACGGCAIRICWKECVESDGDIDSEVDYYLEDEEPSADPLEFDETFSGMVHFPTFERMIQRGFVQFEQGDAILDMAYDEWSPVTKRSEITLVLPGAFDALGMSSAFIELVFRDSEDASIFHLDAYDHFTSIETLEERLNLELNNDWTASVSWNNSASELSISISPDRPRSEGIEICSILENLNAVSGGFGQVKIVKSDVKFCINDKWWTAKPVAGEIAEAWDTCIQTCGTTRTILLTPTK